MKSQREIEIDVYIKADPSALEPQGLSVILHGQPLKQPVYRLPTRLLIFNISNGRFAAEALDAEKRLKRKLDATKPDDAKLIQKLLLEQDKGETESLKKDLVKNGQLDPGIITADGAVINANRRLAILQLLFEETGDEKYEFIRVARLPVGVDERDQWKIEAKLQFGRDFRLEYGAINELLKIRAGRASGLTEKQISEALNHRYSAKQVGEKLNILNLIDTYLSLNGKPGEYRHIQVELRAVEKFISLQSSVITPLEKAKGKTAEVSKLIEIGFAMISRGKGEHRHWDIRDLKDIADLKPAREALWKAFNGGRLNKDGQKISQAFRNAQTILEAQEDKDKPIQLVSDALSVLQQIDSRHPSINTSDFQKLLAKIAEETQRLSIKTRKK